MTSVRNLLVLSENTEEFKRTPREVPRLRLTLVQVKTELTLRKLLPKTFVAAYENLKK